jgi:hypothetical protein
MTIASRQFSPAQKQALAWIRKFGPATRLSDNWWQPGVHALQSRRINNKTIQALVERGELQFTENVVKKGFDWNTGASIEEGLE